MQEEILAPLEVFVAATGRRPIAKWPPYGELDPRMFPLIGEGGMRMILLSERIRLAWSAPILAEYRAVLSRPKFKFSPLVVSSLLTVFSPGEQVTPIAAATLPDPDDEVFLATAMAISDKVLAPGNGALFPAKTCDPVQILTPAEALQRLAELKG